MTPQEFINKANHNQKLIELLESEQAIDFPDWLVVVMFYKCLHWLNAWLVSQGRTRDAFANHGKMRETIDYRERRNKPAHACPVTRSAYEAYDDLYELSRTARYNGFLTEDGMKRLNQSNVIQGRRDVEIIKQFVESRGLSLASPSPPAQELQDDGQTPQTA